MITCSPGIPAWDFCLGTPAQGRSPDLHASPLLPHIFVARAFLPGIVARPFLPMINRSPGIHAWVMGSHPGIFVVFVA